MIIFRHETFVVFSSIDIMYFLIIRQIYFPYFNIDNLIKQDRLFKVSLLLKRWRSYHFLLLYFKALFYNLVLRLFYRYNHYLLIKRRILSIALL